MPYYRKYYRKRFYKKRGYRKGRYMSKFKRLQKTVYKMKDAVGNPEYKHYTGEYIDLSANYTGNVYNLSNFIDQGISDTERIGDNIKMQRLVIRGSFIQKNADSRAQIRLMIFKDKENSVVATDDILSSTGSVSSIFSPKLNDVKFNTKILYDKRFSSVNNTSAEIRNFNINIPLNFYTQFAGGTSDVATNALKFLLISTNSVATAGGELTMIFRMSFTDT